MNEKIIHKNLSDRLLYALKLTGTRKIDLAKAINVKPQIIQFLCSSDTKASRFTFEIATVLGLNTRWLATGEGTMFIADDPKHRFLHSYKLVPILNSSHILNAINESQWPNIDQPEIETVALKSNKENIFAMIMPDQSMEALLPIKSTIFVEYYDDYRPFHNDTVLVYAKQFNAIIIRKFIDDNNTLFLVPHNEKIYQKSQFTNDMKIVGLVTDCHYCIRR